MAKKFIWNDLALGPQLGNGAAKINCVPKNHSGKQQD
jgi:hypothetical protein